MTPDERPSLWKRWSARWSAFSPGQRRRILLASLVALSVAAWDLVLFVTAGSLFMLSELAPARRPVPHAG